MEANGKQTAFLDIPAYYDTLAQDYDALYCDPASQYENGVVWEALRRMDVSNADVLDIGCGTGLLLDLGFRPRRYLGLDVSAEMIARARRKYPDHCFTVGDMASPIAETFEVIVSLFGGASQALHVELSDLLRPLCPGGRFCLMVFADGKGDCTNWRQDRACPHLPAVPVRYYSAKGLRSALARMEDVRIRGLNVCLPVGLSFSLSRFALNATLERVLPSRAALLIATGRRPLVCQEDALSRTSLTPPSTV
jgi:SAM-dependent methyltransferase